MRRSLVLLAGLLLALAGALALPAPTASAATAGVVDPVDSDLPATQDLTRFNVQNRNDKLVLTLQVRNLTLSRSIYYATIKVGSARYVAVANGRGQRNLVKKVGNKYQPAGCRGFLERRSVPHDVVRLHIPQRCFGAQAGTVTTKAFTESPSGRDADSSATVVVAKGSVD